MTFSTCVSATGRVVVTQMSSTCGTIRDDPGRLPRAGVAGRHAHAGRRHHLALVRLGHRPDDRHGPLALLVLHARHHHRPLAHLLADAGDEDLLLLLDEPRLGDHHGLLAGLRHPLGAAHLALCGTSRVTGVMTVFCRVTSRQCGTMTVSDTSLTTVSGTWRVTARWTSLNSVRYSVR